MVILFTKYHGKCVCNAICSLFLLHCSSRAREGKQIYFDIAFCLTITDNSFRNNKYTGVVSD